MRFSRITFRSGFYSVLLHAVALVLLLVSVEFAPQPTTRFKPQNNIIKAVTVDSKQVEAELQRFKQIEKDKVNKQKVLEKKLKELQRKTVSAEKKRKAEEKKLADIKKKKQQESKKRKQEQKKLAQQKKQKEELQRKRKLEQQKKQQAEAERKRLAEQKQKQAAEKKRKEAEAALQKEMDAEQAAEQRSLDQQLLNKIISDIYERVTSNFNRTGLPKGLSCTLRVRLIPGGDVIEVSIEKSSGNDIFDRRAITAVQKSSPFPVPSDIETFDRLKLRDNTLPFNPED